MVVSRDRGTSKSSIFMRFSIIDQPFLDTPFMEPPIFGVAIDVDEVLFYLLYPQGNTWGETQKKDHVLD